MEKLYLSIEKELYLENEKLIPFRTTYPYKLFETKSNLWLYCKYQEELANVNDYIYHNNDYLAKKIKELKENLRKIKKSPDTYKIYDFEVDDEFLFSEELMTWEYLLEKVNKCSNVILLLSLLEGILKEILEFYSKEKKYILEKRKKSENKSEYYLKQISRCCNYDLKLTNSTKKIFDDAKKIRNLFTHEWNIETKEEQKRLQSFKISNLINTLSNILEKCEQAGIEAKIIEKF